MMKTDLPAKHLLKKCLKGSKKGDKEEDDIDIKAAWLEFLTSLGDLTHS